MGAGEAIASRVSTGDADVNDAAELMINLFWRGLKGTPSDGAPHSDHGSAQIGDLDAESAL